MKRFTIIDIASRKNTEPLVVLTAYSAAQAKLLDEHVDILLVGDSLGMVLYGMDSTLAVTVDMMIAHGSAVVRSSSRALVVVDLPFGSYQESPQQAFTTAANIISRTGCAAVKLEGGVEMADTIAFLSARGIPVMGHVGLKPQSVNAMGGYRTQGKNEESAAAILSDAKAIEKAGAFAIVIEGVVEEVARKISANVAVPTIGIGASAACDGQVLVVDDMLGMSSGYIPRFVKRYADINAVAAEAVKQYAQEVRARKFPSAEYCYPYKKAD
ncbi:MAG: 3-methyl-2-oxobutanoate hydroxymethyltransferase [Pseudomonadota bacterium]